MWSKIYNYYLPLVAVIVLAANGKWVWLLGVAAFMLVGISYNLEVLLSAMAARAQELERPSVDYDCE